MITLNLIPRRTPPVPLAADAGVSIGGTNMNFQPATASAVAPSAVAVPFPQLARPVIDLASVRTGMRTIVETTLVDLSVAHSLATGTAVVLPIQGTAYYIDKGADVGVATMHIQDQTNTPVNSISLFPGDANNNIPFTFVVIENAAQAGKVLRIHYGTDIVFNPGLGGNVLFTGGVAITQTQAGAPQGVDLDVSSGHAFVAPPVTNGPTAAQFSGYAIECAAAKRVYVDGIDYLSAVAGFVSVGPTGGLGLANGATNLLNGAINSSVSRRELGTAAATAGQQIELLDGAATWQRLRFPRPIAIDPGNAVYVWCATVNTVASFAIWLREY